MLRKEAIKLLQSAKMMLLGKDNQPVSDLYDALDMAIDALKLMDATVFKVDGKELHYMEKE